MTHKETDINTSKPETSTLHHKIEVEDVFDKNKSELSDKPAENHDSSNDDKIKSRLNPDTEKITEKDPDETIILPNNELKRMNNWKNRNQPF